MALQGNLVDLPLIDLVQVLILQNKTGILSLSQEFSQAQVAFGKSKIYSAYVHHSAPNGKQIYKQGEDALYDILDWPDGQFTFELTSALPPVENVQATMDYLILEHCRRTDERAQKRQRAEILTARPCLVPNPPIQAEISLDLDQWRVLFLINGVHTIAEIAENIRQDPQEIAAIAEKLESKGLIVFNNRTSFSSPANDYQHFYQNQHKGKARTGGTKPLRAVYGGSAFGHQQVVQAAEPVIKAAKPTPELPAVPAERTIPARPPVAPAPVRQPNPVNVPVAATAPAPKVQRSLLSGIMAKIRGL